MKYAILFLALFLLVAPTAKPNTLNDLQAIQQIAPKDLRSTNLLFYQVGRSLARNWDQTLIAETGRVVNLVMDIEQNYQWTAAPFHTIITGRRRNEFIQKISSALNSDEKKKIFAANIHLTLRVFKKGNG